MNATAPPRPPPAAAASPSRGPGYLAAAGIVVAAALAYGGSLHGPLLYDDVAAIARNPTLRHLWTALRPPAGGLPVSGRPLVNFSLALNYALSGTGVWSYHLLNVAIHALAGMTLFGVVRRTIRRKEGQDEATGFAFVAALLWTVHPLQTEAVTYISQRAESLMGLFYLLTLYCFIRYAGKRPSFVPSYGTSEGEKAAQHVWLGATIVCCFFGMATKEVMATAPVIILLYDRIFISGSFAGAWKRHRSIYLGLGATWLLLAYLVAGGAGRGGTAGFGTSVPWWAYAFTQFRAITHYLWLCLWPHPLTFDYGLILGGAPLEMVWAIALVTGLAVSSAVLVFRGSPWGFLGAWFFLILAPSSSVVPVATEIIAEHRAYLSLAAVLVAVVCLGRAGLRRLAEPSGQSARAIGVTGLALGLAAAVALGLATQARNRVYGSVLALWTDAVENNPLSAGARNNLGNALAEAGRLPEAMAQFREALRLAPDYDDPHYNLANALAKTGAPGEAIEHYRAALRFRPHHAEIHYALANALKSAGHPVAAAREYREALTGDSDLPELWYNLGNALLDDGDYAGAATALARAVRLRPEYADALANYAGVLAQLGRSQEAIAAFQAALRLEPGAADVHNNFGGLLAQNGRLAEAKGQFEAALRIKPDYREARDNLQRVGYLERTGARP